MRHCSLLRFLILGVTLTFNALTTAFAVEPGEEISLPRLLRAERFTLNPVSLPDETKILIAFYSASWCAPCHVIGKKLEDLYPNIKEQAPGIEFFTFSVDASARARADYLRDKHYPWLAADPTTRESEDWNFSLPGGTPQFQAFRIEGDRLVALTAADSIGPVLKASTQFLTHL